MDDAEQANESSRNESTTETVVNGEQIEQKKMEMIDSQSTTDEDNPIAMDKTQRQINLNIGQLMNTNENEKSQSNQAATIVSRALLFNRNDSIQSFGHGDYTIMWRNLMWLREKETIILKGICGRFRTGHLTAVMGPSGSGKSTMLDCIVGFRKKGLTGTISVLGDDEDHIKIALITQNDYLIDVLTVREMLVYASKLKNFAHDEDSDGNDDNDDESKDIGVPNEVISTISEQIDNNLSATDSSSKRNLINDKANGTNFHETLVNEVIKKLGLEVCADTFAGNCSGGQRKRISIGLEMISKPNFLILDEPTSGLDSSACYQTVSVMKNLTRDKQSPIGVISTIHQPSARVFNLFDHIYIISYNGYCIYEGSPKNLLQHLSKVDLICPQFHNPADFIAEVASNEHGPKCLQKLIDLKEQQDMSLPDSSPQNEHWLNIRTKTNIQFCCIYIRLASHILIAVFISVLYGDQIGVPSLCPLLKSPLDDLENFATFRKAYQIDVLISTENIAYIFFTLMFAMFGSMMPIIMTFPSNLETLKKEKTNGWYSIAAYYTGSVLSEIPYIMTGQLRDLDRFLWYLLVTTLTASIAQSQGFLVGALFMSDASTAVFLGPITTVPIMLFGGFFVRIKFIPNYLKIFGHLSYLRYSFELMLMIIYGMDRCHLDPEMLNLNQTEPEWKGMANMLLGEGSDKFVDEFAKSLGGVYNAKSGKKYRSTI
ncbi:ATP-binding cassette sub-family G member 1 [Sarcoptes scabiei]|uniref:ATP-binding cassette sub-family G member 1 n=1 Tax=Sarcoptes scabiei TaxID=52283 RepID=A0A834VCG3_SARSC|nr:ATP-binding cassette sub-family G member 1 [Sarcoptes scabiei]